MEIVFIGQKKFQGKVVGFFFKKMFFEGDRIFLTFYGVFIDSVFLFTVNGSIVIHRSVRRTNEAMHKEKFQTKRIINLLKLIFVL